MHYNLDHIFQQTKSKFSSDLNIGHEIFCDIDKTYLETEYDSFVKLAKIAFENAEEKKNVEGATFFLNALHSHNNFSYKLHFVSASPTQLQNVFQKKFYIDLLNWHSLTLKNQIYNIRKIKFSLLKQQTAYKTFAIINTLNQVKKNTNFYFIGDNDESDLYIYLGLFALINKKISKGTFAQYLEFAQISPNFIEQIIKSIKVQNQISAKGIFIRNIPNNRTLTHTIIQNNVFIFHHYLELFIKFMDLGIIKSSQLRPYIRKIHNYENISLDRIYSIISHYMQKYFIQQQSTIDTLYNELKVINKKEVECTKKVNYQTKINHLKNEHLNSQINNINILDFAKNWQNFLHEKKKKG